MDQHTKILIVTEQGSSADRIDRLSSELTGLGFEVSSCEGLEKSELILKSMGIDVLFLDCSVSGDDFGKSLMTVRSDFPDMPIVGVLRDHDNQKGSYLLDAGADDYIYVDQLYPALLEHTVRSAIDRRVLMDELTQYTRELVSSEDRFRNIIATNTDAMIMLRHTGEVLFVNAAAEKLFGRTSVEFQKKTFEYSVESGASREIDIERPGGERSVAEMRVVPAEWEGVSSLLATVRDITDRKRAEDEREKLHNQLLRSEKFRSIGILASGVAHEMNNPLTIILGFAQVLQRELAAAGGLQDRLKEIETATLRCKKIVNQLLSFSQQESFGFYSYAINHAVDNSLELLIYQLESSGVKVVKNLADDLPELKGNMQQVEQVLINLVSNARDAMPSGGTLTIASRLLRIAGDGRSKPSAAPSQVIEITVTDTGVGIPVELMDRIFDPFFSTKAVGQGAGLGLPMSLGIIEKHGGKLFVNSVLGSGTTITIHLPVNL